MTTHQHRHARRCLQFGYCVAATAKYTRLTWPEVQAVRREIYAERIRKAREERK